MKQIDREMKQNVLGRCPKGKVRIHLGDDLLDKCSNESHLDRVWTEPTKERKSIKKRSNKKGKADKTTTSSKSK